MNLAFTCDEGTAQKAALGLIVLKADETLEAEVSPALRSDGVAVFHTRIESPPEITSETLGEMKSRITVVASLLPAYHPLDVVGFACTSGATVIGSSEVSRCVRAVHPDAKVTNPADAVIAACKALDIKRLGLVTPYIAEVSNAVRALLEEHGISVAISGSFGQSSETTVARISLSSTEAAICELGQDETVDAIFASCTNLRTFPIVEACEQKLGKPVLSSNLALAWHMLTLAGLPTKAQGPGRLFER